MILDVPYIANWIYEHPGLALNLKGIWIADPSLSSGLVQQEIPALRFAKVSKRRSYLLSSTKHVLATPIGERERFRIQFLLLGSTTTHF